MQMTGEERIAASRTMVWEALNDPAILRQCIPGCQSLDREADDKLRAVVEIKIGPIGARFNGAVTLSDIDAPNGYTITGEGQGGTVGSAKGGAKVRLSDVEGATLLAYDVDAQVGGRLAQLGGPIIDATAKQLAGKFFKKFGEIVGAEPVAATEPVATDVPAATPTPDLAQAAATTPVRGQAPGFPWSWAIAVAIAVLAGFLLGRSDAAEWWVVAMVLLALAAAGAGYDAGQRNGAKP